MHLKSFPAAAAFLVLFAFCANAQNDVQATIDIGTDGAVHYAVIFNLPSPETGNVTYSVNEMPQNIRVSDGKQELGYSVIGEGEYVIDISLNDPASQIIIEYDMRNSVFESGQIKHFFTEYDFASPVNMNVTLKLPPGYGIYGNSYNPDNATIISDGRRIGLVWNLESVTAPLFSVNYSSSLQESSVASIIAAMLAGTTIAVFYFFRRRSKEAFLEGFRDYERKTLEYLGSKKIALQSDIQKEFAFSRAKTARIVSTLESKGLVKKKRYGRTNKLYWIKPSFTGKSVANPEPKK